MSLHVHDGIAPQWPEHVGEDVPILASPPWLDATAKRLPGHRLTFLASVDGQNGGLQATAIEDPATGEMFNLYRTMVADLKVWKFPATSVEARPGLRDQVAPVEAWMPHLDVVYPGFDSFAAASGGATPGLAAALTDGVLAWAGEHGMKAVSFPYVRADTVLPRILAERGFRAIPLTFRSRLALGRSFDDYLRSLSKNGRSQVTKELRHLAGRGVRTKRCAAGDVWPDVIALRCDLVERYGQRADPDTEARDLRQIVDSFGEDQIRLYCSFLDDRVVGFSLYAVWRDTWYAAYTGTYVTPRTRNVFFDHLFYTPIADAIGEGARTLDVGIGAWEAKRRRGCTLTPVDLWVRAMDPAVEHGIEAAAPAMRREVGWVQG
jgi:hypothetical protein